MSQTEFRIILLCFGALILGAIYWFSRQRKPASVMRARGTERESAPMARIDPSLGVDDPPRSADADSSTGGADQVKRGARAALQYDKVISVHLMAKEGQMISGQELVVAAEKASLVHGDRGLYHRLVDGQPDEPPVFSVINRVQPGSFELNDLDALQTPGISFFMTLPGPLAGLDAWDRLYPAALRMSELLDAQLMDDEHNPLNRQRVAGIRDDLRTYDRSRAQAEARHRR